MEIGEKSVRMVFMSGFLPGRVVCSSPVPEIIAVCIWCFVLTYPLMFSYRYFAVSVKAVKTMTLRLPGFIGLATFLSMSFFSSCSLLS